MWNPYAMTKQSLITSGTMALTILLCSGTLMLQGCNTSSSQDDKKLLVFGWDTQKPEQIRHRMEVYESSPFDGMVIGAKIPRTVTLKSGREMDRLDWLTWGVEINDEDVAQSIADLAARPDALHCTELFFRVNTTPGVDWFDDEAFERRVERNWRHLGRMVREGRLPGLLFDAEQYPGFDPPFSYVAASQNGRYSLPQCLDQVYRRGQKLIHILNKEVDDLEILFIVGTAWNKWITYKGHEAGSDYQLLPAFIDGLMSAASPNTRFHDLWEGSYRYKERWQFERARQIIRGVRGAENSLIPQTYMEKIQAGFGIWICDSLGVWDPANPFYTPQELENTLKHAFDLTDKYVWIYHERIQPWAIDHPSQIKFSDAYWQVIQRAVAPYQSPGPSYQRSRPDPVPSSDAQSSDAKLAGHWPLIDSLKNRISGNASFQSTQAKFESADDDWPRGFQVYRWPNNLTMSTENLPANLNKDCTISASYWPAEAGAKSYVLLSGALSAMGPIFELRGTGNGDLMRIEVTIFDPKTGKPTAWQKTGHHYKPNIWHQMTLRFRDGQFDGLFIDDHQAIFGLWDLNKTPREIEPRRVVRNSLYVGVGNGGPRVCDNGFWGVASDLRIYRGALGRDEILALGAEPD